MRSISGIAGFFCNHKTTYVCRLVTSLLYGAKRLKEFLSDSLVLDYLRSGRINETSSHGYINNAGNNGYYWSSVVNSASDAYDFYFNTGTNFNPSDNQTRYRGLPIRCVIRSNPSNATYLSKYSALRRSILSEKLT